MRIFSALIATTLTLLIFTGCENDEETNLFKAQQCIDTATDQTVSACSAFLAGDTSQRSYILRCSIAFVSENITETQIVEALKNIDKDGQAKDPTITAFSALTMKDTDTSIAALNTCKLSGSTALEALANFANLATATASLGSILNDPSEANIENFLNTYNDATDASALGAAVVASQDSLCNPTNGLMKDTESCQNINQAIAAGTSNDQIGDLLISNIKNPNN